MDRLKIKILNHRVWLSTRFTSSSFFLSFFMCLKRALQKRRTVCQKDRAKMWSPLAAQPPGTGKTELGCNIAAVLQREDFSSQAEIPQRLLIVGMEQRQCGDAYPSCYGRSTRRDPRNAHAYGVFFRATSTSCSRTRPGGPMVNMNELLPPGSAELRRRARLSHLHISDGERRC